MRIGEHAESNNISIAAGVRFEKEFQWFLATDTTKID